MYCSVMNSMQVVRARACCGLFAGALLFIAPCFSAHAQADSKPDNKPAEKAAEILKRDLTHAGVTEEFLLQGPLRPVREGWASKHQHALI